MLVALKPTKTMVIICVSFLLLSNAVRYVREKSILNSKTIISFLLFILLLDLFFYFIFGYVLGLSSFSLYFGLALILLLRLIDYTSNFYYIDKTKIGIKPYSRIDNILDVFIDIVLYLFTLITLVRSIITSIMSPVNSLLSVIFIEIKSIIIYTFTSTPYYKALTIIYYKEGFISLLNNLAILIYYNTTNYIRDNLYYILGFLCVCVYQILLGYDLLLIISLLYTIIHLPLFIISIITYITIINRNFYKQHPLLFKLYICACIILFFALILLSVILYSMISHLMDDYFIQAKGDNGGSSGGPGSKHGSGSGPDPNGGNSGPSLLVPDTTNKKKKGKQKEENIKHERISHINIVTEEYIEEATKVHNNPNLTVRERRHKLDELVEK